jgi:hypothetical protein
MVVVSLLVWVGNPVLWLWITSRLESGIPPSMGPYGLMLVGVVATGIALARVLSWLNRLYQRVTGTEPTVRVIVPWRRSSRGERVRARDDEGRLPLSLLDVVMVVTVVVAVTALVVWFLIVEPTPPGLEPGPAK